MLNQNELNAIYNKSETAKVVMSDLSKRLRFRRQTNLSKYHADLINKGFKIVEDEYISIFKELQYLGAGTLIIGRKGKPNRFIWNYNLKDIAKKASGDQVEIRKLDKTAQRPVKQQPKEKAETVTINLQIPIELVEFLKKLSA